MHMPRSSIPVVSSSLALALRGPQPSGVLKPSAFPGLRPVILLDHNHTFSGLSHAACTLATPGFIRTLTGYARRFARDLVANLLSWELGQSPHPLGNSIQFHSFRSDPEDLDLLDTTTLATGGWLALTSNLPDCPPGRDLHPARSAKLRLAHQR